MKLLRLTHRPTFLYDYLRPSLSGELIEMTQPDSPRSPKQKYRLTEKGKQMVMRCESRVKSNIKNRRDA
jgi:ATP-dependent DNA helicase RecG